MRTNSNGDARVVSDAQSDGCEKWDVRDGDGSVRAARTDEEFGGSIGQFDGTSAGGGVEPRCQPHGRKDEPCGMSGVHRFRRDDASERVVVGGR